MVELMRDYWWVFLALWIVAKISRKAESSKKIESDSKTSDAENVMLAITRSLTEHVEDKSLATKILTETSKNLAEDKPFQKALLDGLIERVEKDEIKTFTPVEGSHPLTQLAERAVAAETKKQKVVRGLKKGAVIGLKILRGGLA